MTTLMSTIAGPLEYFSTSVTDILASKKVADDLIAFIDGTDDDEPNRSLELAEPITTLSIENLHFHHGNRLILMVLLKHLSVEKICYHWRKR